MRFRQRYRSIIGTVILIWTFAITLGRGIRLPNDFAEAHWLVDYRFGPMKRGLIGSLCSLSSSVLGFSVTPNLIVWLSALIFGGMCLSFVYVSARMLRSEKGGTILWLLALIVASSPFVVMSGHLFGYFDALLYLLTVTSVALVVRGRPMAAGIVSSAAVMVHESYLLIGLPLVFFGAVHALLRMRSGERSYASLFITVAAPIAVFGVLMLLQNFVVDATTLRAQLAERLHSFGFVQTRADGVAQWQTITLLEYYHNQRHLFWERLRAPEIFIAVAPVVAAVVTMIHGAFRIRPFSLFSLALLGVLFVPVTMHLVAWDTARISTYVIASGFLATWILAEYRVVTCTSNLYLLIALPALLLNVFGTIPLMDEEVERFSSLVRLALYSPALVFVVALIFEDVKDDCLQEFRLDDSVT